MLPEMFCSAKDCACRPPTEVFSASKIPITLSPQSIARQGWPQSRETVASVVPKCKRETNQSLERKYAGQMTGAHLPGGQLLPGTHSVFERSLHPDLIWGWNRLA